MTTLLWTTAVVPGGGPRVLHETSQCPRLLLHLRPRRSRAGLCVGQASIRRPGVRCVGQGLRISMLLKVSTKGRRQPSTVIRMFMEPPTPPPRPQPPPPQSNQAIAYGETGSEAGKKKRLCT